MKKIIGKCYWCSKPFIYLVGKGKKANKQTICPECKKIKPKWVCNNCGLICKTERGLLIHKVKKCNKYMERVEYEEKIVTNY